MIYDEIIEKDIEELKKELLGYEMNFIELDNTMMNQGYASEANSDSWLYALEDGNIVYTRSFDDGFSYQAVIQIFFDIIYQCEEEKYGEIVKIVSVEKF